MAADHHQNNSTLIMYLVDPANGFFAAPDSKIYCTAKILVKIGKQEPDEF
jgi:hypothetical protein